MIEQIEPEIDAGRHPAKRILGERVRVYADVFTDGHDRLRAALLFRRVGETSFREVPMEPLVSDRWCGSFLVDALGLWEFTVEGWIDAFASWRAGTSKKAEAGLDLSSELLEGAALVAAAAPHAEEDVAAWLRERAARIGGEGSQAERAATALDPALADAMARVDPRAARARHPRLPRILVERERAAFGAWYELFPRSCSPEPGRHGTLRDCEARLPEIAAMGFDVVYLPPVHPIGRTHRKGPNNAATAAPGDPGSPWAIGAVEGGHTAIHPELGTLDDFDRLVARARSLGMEIAIDIAFQCSPDHPYVSEHPEWFRWRPDGTVQYAENPPKRYQDVLPLHFEGEAWEPLWAELRDVVLFWARRGVLAFRVDNPHTKPFAFWEWLLAEVRAQHPEAIFLSEAFTRPAVMKQLAKIGFSQSYTYFTWRNTRTELERYLHELTRTEAREYLRPNFFANTPDILPEYLQAGGRTAFLVRVVLAATLSGSYGIYGPLYERCVADAIPGTEEYLDSEKYELRFWPADAKETLRPWITRLNALRRDNPAFRHPERLRFVPCDDDAIAAYVCSTPDLANVVVVVVNLDPHHARAGWVELPLEALDIDDDQSYQMQDLLGGGRFLWQGPRNYVALEPGTLPAHVLRLRRRARSERDFDYFA